MRATLGSRVKFVDSTVDETLFGERTKAREPIHVPEFEPPWVDNGKTQVSPSKPLLFYCPTSSSNSSRSQARKESPSRSGYKPVKFSPSYTDDTLFGNRRTKRSNSPPPKDFRPPWVKEGEKKSLRPLLFDGKARHVFDNSTEKIDTHRTIATPQPGSKPRGSRSASRRRPSTGNPSKPSDKPPWR